MSLRHNNIGDIIPENLIFVESHPQLLLSVCFYTIEIINIKDNFDKWAEREGGGVTQINMVV